MQWKNDLENQCVIGFSLRDLRRAKGLGQKQIASVLGVSKSLYHAIESGTRKPSADVLFKLALVYQTSMDFIYHAFHRQYYTWNFPDGDLAYAMRKAKEVDIQYLRDRVAPLPPPDIPVAYVLQREFVDETEPDFAPYGLKNVKLHAQEVS